MPGPKARKGSSEVKGICAILEACLHSGVSELKFGDLEVRFHSPGSPRQEEPPFDESFSALPAEMGEQAGLEEMSPARKAELEEIRQAQVLIDDPAAFETEQIDLLERRG